MKYLVTGGAGFIGSNIVKKILELGQFVRVVDNLSTGREENLKEFLGQKNFEFIKGDLTNLETCRQVVKDIDYILHQAAIPSVPRSIADPIASNQANVLGTLNLLVAARDQGKIEKFVYASSSSIYGDSPRLRQGFRLRPSGFGGQAGGQAKLPKQETDPINPISPYALSKYTGERYCQIFYKIYGLPTICLRYFNVFGPNQDPTSQYAAVIPRFIKAMLHGEPPIIYGDGEQSRDFTYVDNVVEANLLAAKSKISGEVINIACGQKITVNKIIKLINRILKTDIKPIHQPTRPGDIKHSLADISKAKKMLGYQPKINFEEGLEKTLNWFRIN